MQIARSSGWIVAGMLTLVAVTGCVPSKSHPNRDLVYRDALAVIRQAADDKKPAVRAYTMELLPKAMGTKAGAMFKQALSDPVAEVRFAAAMGIGDVRYEPAKEKLLIMAKEKTEGAEPDARVYCAIIYALHRLGDDTHTSDLAVMLADRRKNVRASAVVAMGRMKESSAKRVLKQVIGEEADQGLRLELTKALAMCGDVRSQRLLESYTMVRFVDERVLAIEAMSDLKSRTGPNVYSQRFEDDESPRVRVTAAGALAREDMASREMLEYCLRAATKPYDVMLEALEDREPTDAEVISLEQLTAKALKYFDDDCAVAALKMLLKADNKNTRVTAAASLLEMLPAPADMAPKKVKPKAAEPVKKEMVPAAPPASKKLKTSGAK